MSSDAVHCDQCHSYIPSQGLSCRERAHPPFSTNTAQMPPCQWLSGNTKKAKLRMLTTKTPTLCKTPAHDRHPQGLLKQPEPPACHRLSRSTCRQHRTTVLFAAAANPQGGRHLTQPNPSSLLQLFRRRAAPLPPVLYLCWRCDGPSGLSWPPVTSARDRPHSGGRLADAIAVRVSVNLGAGSSTKFNAGLTNVLSRSRVTAGSLPPAPCHPALATVNPDLLVPPAWHCRGRGEAAW